MAMTERRIQISIDSLSLNGFSRREADQFEAAFRSELSTLLTTARSPELVSRQQDRLAGQVSVGNAEAMGRNVARTIVGGLVDG